MLQTSLLFLYTVNVDKNYNEELESRSTRIPLMYFSTVLTICALISFLGLIGNGVVVWLLCCTIEKTKFTVYVANLAVGDFMALLRTFISILEYFKPVLVTARLRQLMIIMYFFGHETSSFFLAAMSTERCLTVFSPIWYQSYRRKCSTVLICALLWTLSVILAVLYHFFCTYRYILALNIGTYPCTVATMFQSIMTLIILTPSMVFSTLALFIRMKRKPQQNLPASLDISILATVVLHFISYPAIEIISFILISIQFRYYLQFYYLSLIFDVLHSSINPFIYLLIGSWKREKGQEPFCMFLERALRDERKGTRRTQPDQEQA